MQSFQRTFALFSIVAATVSFAGCGGPGTPTPGGSDPVMEAADAALAPEGGPVATDATAEGTGEAAPDATTPEATEPAAEGTEAEAAPETGN